jgi:hypothetical protein
LPLTAFERAPPPLNKGKRPRDFGIDCASIDFSTTVQAKWYKPKSSVNWSDIANFLALSILLQSKKIIIVTSSEVKLHRLASEGLAHIIEHMVMTDARINEICNIALRSTAAAPLIYPSINDEYVIVDNSAADNAAINITCEIRSEMLPSRMVSIMLFACTTILVVLILLLSIFA